MRRILRAKEAWAKVACGKTKFEEDYRHHSDNDPYVTGTKDVLRLKEIPLGDRLIGFLEHEVDALIDALARRRDTVSVGTPRPRTAIGAEGRRKVAERAPAFSASHPIRVAVMKGGSPAVDEAVIGYMVKFIKDNRIDVFMVDPLVSFHSVAENDNSHMDLVIKRGFGAVVAKTNAAGEVFHHPGKPKPNQPETVVEDGRGASAILWAVRSARVLNFMTPAEAEKLGMSDEERKLHIRIANGKANMAPLGKAKWMKIEVENLPNGDQVACGSSWTPPNPFEGLTTADLELAQKLARTAAYRDDSRSKEWFGYALAKHLGLDVSFKGTNDPKDLAKLKSIIKTWKQNKVLDVEQREDEHRHEKAFIVPGKAATTAGKTYYSDDDEAVLQ